MADQKQETMTVDEAWAHVQRTVEGVEQDGESVFNGTDLEALRVMQTVIDRDAKHAGKMALTAEEVEVAYGLGREVLRTSERPNSGVRPLSDREDRLLRDMSLMLGSSADGERRG